MALIVPSILEDTIQGFQEKMEAILKIPGVERIQVDVCDGKFVERRTVQVADIEPLDPAHVWELHLMCEDPATYFLDAKIAGFSTVLFPFEVGGDRAQLAQKLRDLKIEPGLSVNPETSAEEIQPYLHLFSQVVLLAVQPGYQGQQYIEQTTEKAQKLSGMKGVFKIEVDGGISTENTARVSQAGADYLVAGSSLFQNGSPAATYKKLQCSR